MAAECGACEDKKRIATRAKALTWMPSTTRFTKWPRTRLVTARALKACITATSRSNHPPPTERLKERMCHVRILFLCSFTSYSTKRCSNMEAYASTVIRNAGQQRLSTHGRRVFFNASTCATRLWLFPKKKRPRCGAFIVWNSLVSVREIKSGSPRSGEPCCGNLSPSSAECLRP